MEPCTKRITASRTSRKLSAASLWFIAVRLVRPARGHHLFSEGVLILASVVIGDAKYTSIVILIWVSNSVATIAEVIFFDIDLIDIVNVSVVEYLDT